MSVQANDVYRVTLREARSMVIRVMDAGLVPFIVSSPGMGKSAMVKSISNEFNLNLIDHRLSASPPEDMNGLPIPDLANNKAKYVNFNIFPTESDEIPDGFNGWLIFLDEFNQAHHQTQAASYKFLLDRMIGQENLHKNVAIMLAGNLSTDRAQVQKIGTALESRVVHIEIVSNTKNWIEDVAIPQEYDSRIIAYLSNNSTHLNDFNPNHNNKVFCCERTWEHVNKLIKQRDVSMKDLPLLAGTISPGIASSFVNFIEVFDQLVPISEIEADPDGARLPNNQMESWATVSMLIDRTNETNFETYSKYVSKMSMEFRIIYLSYVSINKKEVAKSPYFATALSQLDSYLHDNDPRSGISRSQ